MPVLIDRLVLRKLFGLAILICQYLKIPDAEGQSRIMAHWACYKVGAVSSRPHQLGPYTEGPLGLLQGRGSVWPSSSVSA